MIEELTEVFTAFPAIFEGFFLVFLRIGATMFVLPVFGEMMVPLRVKLAGVLAFSLVVYPVVGPVGADIETPILLAGLGEIITGLAIGLILRVHIMAIQVAATMAAQATSLSQLLGGASVDPQPAIGMVLYMASLALAVELGLHVQFARMFIMSYGTVSAGDLIGSDLAKVITAIVANSFEFAFVLAAPFVVVALVYNLTLGVINRAMPQLMVAFVGAPAITYGALVLLALTAPLILSLWLHSLEALIANPFGER
ncbi:MAG: flagellar biosynthetic protein FliR [Pseudomonadota bacterium]